MKRILLGLLVGFTLVQGAVPVEAAPKAMKTRNHRRQARKAPVPERSLLTSTLEISELSVEENLRDAPAAWLAAVPVARTPAPTPGLFQHHNFATLEAGPSRPVDSRACLGSARNLRFIIRAAQGGTSDGQEVVRRRLGSGLRRELALLRRSEAADDARVSLLTTDAQMELEAALDKLGAGRLSASAFRDQVLMPASRAAKNLELAARHLSPGNE